MSLEEGTVADRMWRNKYGEMTVIATDQFRGRLQECPCGKRVWSSWGNAEKHAIACPQSGHPVHSQRAPSDGNDDASSRPLGADGSPA